MPLKGYVKCPMLRILSLANWWSNLEEESMGQPTLCLPFWDLDFQNRVNIVLGMC